MSESASESESASSSTPRLVTLDGSKGEGGGQILRTALTLALLTGRPFRIVKIRANRDKPGLRPQHVTAVASAAELGGPGVAVIGGTVGSRDLTFRPAAYTPSDLRIDIGTAGSTALVLQTLHLATALRTDRPVRAGAGRGDVQPLGPVVPIPGDHLARAPGRARGSDRPGDARRPVSTPAAGVSSTPGSSRRNSARSP